MKIVFRRSQKLIEELEVDPTMNILESVMNSLQEVEQQLELIIQASQEQSDNKLGRISTS